MSLVNLNRRVGKVSVNIVVSEESNGYFDDDPSELNDKESEQISGRL